MWLSLLIVHLIGIVGYNLLLRRSVLAKTDKWLLATILQTGICIPAIFIAVFFPFKIPVYNTGDLLLCAASVLLTILLQALNVKALQYLETSVYSVVYNTRIVMASILGVLLLSEKLTPVQLLGGFLIFCSVFIVRQKEKFHATKIGLLVGFGAAVTLSLLNITEKLLNQRVGLFEYFIPVTIVTTIIMWSVLFMRRTQVSLPFLMKPSILSLMGFRALSAFGFSSALVFGPVALSNYISSLSVILMVLCGALFLNEKDYLGAKIVATIIAFAGLTLTLLGKP